MAARNPESRPGPDYDPHAWHDDIVCGMRFHTPDLTSPQQIRGEIADDWTSMFILDIDHIVAWVHGEDGDRFHVAPADLIFRNVSELEMTIDWGNTGAEMGMHEPSIDHIARTPVPDGKGRGSRYRWQIVLKRPAGGEIAFQADGFELRQRCPPVLRDEQQLPVSRPA